MTAPATAPTSAAELARKAHRTLEPLHTVVYFTPEPIERYAALGITGSMRGYFASRSAAFGVVPGDVVVATFYNFAPAAVHKYVPSVWEKASPEQVLQARLDGVDAAMRRLLGDEVLTSDAMAEAAALAREATTACDPIGRALYAAHAALPWPEAPHLQLWHAQTLLREHRGDGHVAALLLAGLEGCEALVAYAPLGQGLPVEVLKASRGWTPEQWSDAEQRLRGRGILDDAGGLTEVGLAQRTQIEAQTDAAAAAPYALLGPDRTQRLRELARPWSRAISEQLFANWGA